MPVSTADRIYMQNQLERVRAEDQQRGKDKAPIQKIKCKDCHRRLEPSEFSEKQLREFRMKSRTLGKAAAQDAEIARCKDCGPQQSFEAQCVMCDEFKSTEEFSKIQRKSDEPKCKDCMEERLTGEMSDKTLNRMGITREEAETTNWGEPSAVESSNASMISAPSVTASSVTVTVIDSSSTESGTGTSDAGSSSSPSTAHTSPNTTNSNSPTVQNGTWDPSVNQDERNWNSVASWSRTPAQQEKDEARRLAREAAGLSLEETPSRHRWGLAPSTSARHTHHSSSASISGASDWSSVSSASSNTTITAANSGRHTSMTSNAGSGRTSSNKCYSCGRAGHISRNCPGSTARSSTTAGRGDRGCVKAGNTPSQ